VIFLADHHFAGAGSGQAATIERLAGWDIWRGGGGRRAHRRQAEDLFIAAILADQAVGAWGKGGLGAARGALKIDHGIRIGRHDNS